VIPDPQPHEHWLIFDLRVHDLDELLAVLIWQSAQVS
jgi:hypothetical protein